MFVEQRAASSSILGSKLLQLKYITEKNLLADGLEETGEVTEFESLLVLRLTLRLDSIHHKTSE